MKELLDFLREKFPQVTPNKLKITTGFLTLLTGFSGIIYGIYLCVTNAQNVSSPDQNTVVLASPASTFSDAEFGSSAAAATPSGVVVYVSGAVKKPGLYELPTDSRIFNALEKAGGLTPVADSDFIQKELNLAEKVKEGQKIYFPSSQKEADTQTSHPNQMAGQSEQISINSASAAQLDTLPGIGEKLAEKIITGRPYETIDELVTKIKIGQSVFDKLKDLIKI